MVVMEAVRERLKAVKTPVTAAESLVKMDGILQVFLKRRDSAFVCLKGLIVVKRSKGSVVSGERLWMDDGKEGRKEGSIVALVEIIYPPPRIIPGNHRIRRGYYSAPQRAARISFCRLHEVFCHLNLVLCEKAQRG